MRWLLGLLLLVAFPAAAKDGVRVTVTRDAAGSWTIDYDFLSRAPVWFFPRSAGDLDGRPWRAQSWTVETPGVRLERAGHFDVLTGNGAPLRHVRLRMAPFAQPLTADYTPALAFSDGGFALYSDHFLPGPMPSLAAVAALPIDLNDAGLAEMRGTLILADAGHRLLLGGKVSTGTARFALGREGTYLYSGDAPVIDTEAFAGVIDPGLPAWVRTELDTFTPRLMRLYADRLGKPAGGKPMALVAWQGSERSGWSLGGSVLDGMVVMQISGKRVLEPSPDVLMRMRWFIGHESAHFWLGQTVNYSRRSEAWIMEGGADLLAIRAFQQLVPDYDPHAQLQDELDDCLKRNGAGKPLATAEERGEMRANYACGAMLYRAAESAAKGDVFAFVRQLIDTNRKDGIVTTADWLAAFQAAAGEGQAGAVRAFVEKGVADPRAFWTQLFAATGVAFTLDGDRIVLG
jgi:hypothetical protein